MSTRRRVRSFVGVLSLLLIGAVLGVAGDRLLHSRGTDSPFGNHLTQLGDHVNALRGDLHESALGELKERLHLDEAQLSEIDGVFRRHQIRVDEAWASLRPQVESAVDSVHQHIASILRPDQRAAFHDWMASGAATMEPREPPDSRD